MKVNVTLGQRGRRMMARSQAVIGDDMTADNDNGESENASARGISVENTDARDRPADWRSVRARKAWS